MRISSEREFDFAVGDAACVDARGEISAKERHSDEGGLIGAGSSGPLERSLIEPREAEAHTGQQAATRARGFDAIATRTLDILVASAMLLVLLPAMVLIYVALKLTEPGPALFRHRRIGRGGKSFSCLKFRTMCVDADQRLTRILAQDEALLNEWTSTQKLISDPRVTRLGRFLRNTSLDELPQLFNVLRGDMSLVGPRPIVQDELRRYGRYAAKYCSVTPGLTGLWQVTRTESTTYRRRVATDIHYVRNRSFNYDCRILFATIPAVLAGNG